MESQKPSTISCILFLLAYSIVPFLFGALVGVTIYKLQERPEIKSDYRKCISQTPLSDVSKCELILGDLNGKK